MLLGVACATPPVSPLSEPKAQPRVAEPAHSDRFKQGTQRVVDSAEPPDWLARGAGCSLGQMTAMEQGQATVVPAHLCVGVASASTPAEARCASAEAQAWAGIAKLFGVDAGVRVEGATMRFGGQTAMIQGARVDATWRGMYAKSSVCAVQVVWPVQAFDQLQASWSERSARALKLYQDAVNGSGSTATRCEQLKQSKELLSSIPGNRTLEGEVQNSSLLADLVVQSIGQRCTSEKTVILGTLCLMDDEAMKCPSAVKSRLAGVLSRAGWQIVGSELAANNLAQLFDGGQDVLRQESTRQAARFMAAVKVDVQKLLKRNGLMLCRGDLDFRLLDSRSGAAIKTFEHTQKGGGLDPKQCFQKTAAKLVKRASQPLAKVMTADP